MSPKKGFCSKKIEKLIIYRLYKSFTLIVIYDFYKLYLFLKYSMSYR